MILLDLPTLRSDRNLPTKDKRKVRAPRGHRTGVRYPKAPPRDGARHGRRDGGNYEEAAQQDAQREEADEHAE